MSGEGWQHSAQHPLQQDFAETNDYYGTSERKGRTIQSLGDASALQVTASQLPAEPTANEEVSSEHGSSDEALAGSRSADIALSTRGIAWSHLADYVKALPGDSYTIQGLSSVNLKVESEAE